MDLGILTKLVVISSLIGGLAAAGVSAQATPTLTFDDDMAVSIVRTSPDAEMQIVAGQDGLFTRTGEEPWERTGDAPTRSRIVAAGDDPQLLIAGDEVPCMRGPGTAPMVRSADGGATWTDIDETAGLWPLAIDAESGIGVAASCLGVSITVDGGETWGASDAIEPGLSVTSSGIVVNDADGLCVLLGLTTEGGSSSLVQLEVEPDGQPTASSSLREYWGVGALSGVDNVRMLGAADGIWFSPDAGETWERVSKGLDDVVLAEDPGVAGLPIDVEPGSFGINAIWPIVDQPGTWVIGTADGAFVTADLDEGWIGVPGISGPVEWLQANADGTTLIVESADGVVEVPLSSRSD